MQTQSQHSATRAMPGHVFSIGCELVYAVGGQSEFLFNIQAARTLQQRVLEESLAIDGAHTCTEHIDPSIGNRFVRASAAGGTMTVRYRTTLEVRHHQADPSEIAEIDVAALPIETLPYVLPSRYCQSDRLLNLATREFGNLPRGFARVEAVCDWVHRTVRFLPGTTNTNTSAVDVLVQGNGVCRDFAHLTIALLRALNIPARFVTGYDYGIDPSYGPTDFHAYVEAFLGDRWWIFDATRLAPRNGLVRIGTGRDAADCAFATIFGPTRYQSMKLDIEPVSGEVRDDRGIALSTSRVEDGMLWQGARRMHGDYQAAA
jgi:transglutaminase-like putative cysteine protease